MASVIADPSGSTGGKGGRPKAPASKQDTEQLAAILLVMLGALGELIGGREARLLDSESEAINPPLQRLLARLGAKSVRAIQGAADPLILAWLLTLYGTRVAQCARARRPSPGAAAVPPSASPVDAAGGPPASPPPSNGVIPTGISDPVLRTLLAGVGDGI